MGVIYVLSLDALVCVLTLKTEVSVKLDTSAPILAKYRLPSPQRQCITSSFWQEVPEGTKCNARETAHIKKAWRPPHFHTLNLWSDCIMEGAANVWGVAWKKSLCFCVFIVVSVYCG